MTPFDERQLFLPPEKAFPHTLFKLKVDRIKIERYNYPGGKNAEKTG